MCHLLRSLVKLCTWLPTLAQAEGAVLLCRSIHGALPWRGDHDRRMVLYRFNPGHSAYTPGVAEFNCAPAQPHPLYVADGLLCGQTPTGSSS